MNKIKNIKIKNEDGSISEQSYPIAIDAKNVDMTNGYDVQEVIGDIDVNEDGSIADQLKNYKDYDSDIEDLYSNIEYLAGADEELEDEMLDLLGTKINKNDIVDNLESTATNKVLSANQGKILGDAVDTLDIDIKKKAYFFNTVAEMKAANLQVGDYVCTLGYYTVNDGGAAEYKIVENINSNEYQEELENSLYASIILKNKVSPEMFGAYGDGIHDDTIAWNKAVSMKRDVKAFEKTYLTGQINVANNIEIDCGNANFICNSTTLFKITGKIVTTLINQTDYTKNDTNYTIANTQYQNYSGMVFIYGNNNFQEDRDYYLGGFAATFKNGKINNAYPIPITNTQIDIINPITIKLHNINNIVHQNSQSTAISIYILYGYGCEINNINCKNAVCYTTLCLEKSLNINMNNLNITQEIQTSDNNSYIIAVRDSSFCNLTNSYLYNRYWHTYTTGGQYLCYRNTIDKCELLASNAPSMSDHRNALGTTITNSTTSGITVSGMATLKNIVNTSVREHNSKRCTIALMPMSIEDNAIYNISDVILVPDNTCTFCGVILESDVQVTGKTFYYKDIKLKNIKCNSNIVKASSGRSASDTTCHIIIRKYHIDNCELEINGLSRGAETQWDISDSDLYLSNINYDIQEGNSTRKSDVGTATSDNFNRVHINNCVFRLCRGSCIDLNLNGYRGMSAITMNVSGKLTGSNILSNINDSVILGASQVSINDIIVYNDNKRYNVTSNNGHIYYQKIDDNGIFTTFELT